MNLSVIVLTKNEDIHLGRCLESVSGLAAEIIVVDCGSTDRTRDISEQYSALFLYNPWVNYSSQFSFGITKINVTSEWIMRIDADEYLSEKLQASIRHFLVNPPEPISGCYFPRRMAFLGRKIKHGGIFPAQMLRLFRVGKGRIEKRWMDEHIKVEGETVVLEGELIDDNLNSLTWWTDKHNNYASREAIDMLNLEFGFMQHDSVASTKDGSQAGLKRWIKEKIYSQLPSGFRAFAYFLYRYVVRLGFLDGKEGTMFHFLQGFWYRYLVDCKVYEVKRYMRTHDVDVKVAIKEVFNIEV